MATDVRCYSYTRRTSSDQHTQAKRCP